MPHKFYRLQNLEKFNNNELCLHRFDTKNVVYNYSDVLQEVADVLAKFQQLELPEGVGIALQISAGHTPASCVLLLSILNHNCHFCPLATDVSAEETLVNLTASGAHYFIADIVTKQKHFDKNLFMEFTIYDEKFKLFSVARNTNSPSLPRDGDFCYTIGTTGSTGTPKMVHVPYECIAPNVLALSARLELTSNDVIFLNAPMTFDTFVVEFFMALVVGAALLITPRSLRLVPDKLLPLLFPSKGFKSITLLQITPSLLRTFGANSIREVMLARDSSLSVLLLGGEEFPSPLELQSWLPDNYSKTRIFNIYGITELSCWSTIYECDWRGVQDLPDSIPLGAAIDSETLMFIVDDAGRVVEGAGQGELLLGSATRRCHIPQVQEETLVEGVFFRRTGDLVERIDNSLYYLGRLDNIIKRFGKRLCLDILANKISTLLCNIFKIKTVCLMDKKTEKLICCLTPTTKTDALELDLILSNCRSLIQKQLSNDEKPDRIEIVFQLPLNLHGKVDRKALLQIIKTNDYTTKRSICPLVRFQNFISQTLALDIFPNVNDKQQEDKSTTEPPSNKRQKSSNETNFSLSFTKAGGTSFHALSLSAEIGETFAFAADQRRLLEMLLNDSMTLKDISNFLFNTKVRILQKETLASSNSLHLIEKYQFELVWRVDLHKCIDSSPVHLNERYICVGSHSHHLVTLDASSGTEVSRITLPDRIECKVALDDSGLLALPFQLSFVGCYDGYLYGFHALSGVIRSRINCGGMIKAQPLIFKDTVIVASYAEDYNLVCICLKSYDFIWRKNIGNGGKGIFATPRLFGAWLLVCVLDGNYACVDVNNGHIRWMKKCESPIFSSPVLLRNETEFVLAEVSGKVHTCNATSGKILHTFQAEGIIFSSIVTTRALDGTADFLLFGAHDSNVYCLKYADDNVLTLVWRAYLNAPVYATPALLLSRFVVVCSSKGLLNLLALNTGQCLATHDLKAEVFSTPCCSSVNRKVYFGCRDNFVYCFNIH